MPIARFLAKHVVAHAYLYNRHCLSLPSRLHVLQFRAIHLEQEIVACSGVSRRLSSLADSFTLYSAVDVRVYRFPASGVHKLIIVA